MKKLAFGALALLALFPQPALADGGFRLDGETFDDAKVVFDPAGLDRDSPEASARSFLKVLFGLRADAGTELKAGKIQVDHMAKRMGPLLTDDARNDILAESRKMIAAAEKRMGEPHPIKIEVTKKDGDGDQVNLEYKVRYFSVRPCVKCEDKPRPECTECKGKGVVEKEVDEPGRITVKKDGAIWRIKTHQTPCWSCKGKDEPDEDCRICKGTGFREDDMIKGPPPIDGQVDAKLPKKDLSTPEAAFDTFAATLRVLRVEERTMDSRFASAFEEFKKHLLVAAAPPEKPKHDVKAPVRLEVQKQDDGSVWVTYMRADGPEAGEKKKASGRIKLVKVRDSWLVAAFEEKCWSCGYGDEEKKCEKCGGSGFAKVKNPPY